VSWQIKKRKKEKKGKTNSNKNNVQTKKRNKCQKKVAFIVLINVLDQVSS
jgi:hypothetical protein